ncbi:hypothetical protein BF95_04965 [Sphingobium sp. Ant17]|nr:hypothetical protein BF95_04965 [Sphingobium sp. Ant17]
MASQIRNPALALPADIARLSPISWRHINFLGRYDFSVPTPSPTAVSGRYANLIPNGTFEKKYRPLRHFPVPLSPTTQFQFQ